MPSFAIADCPTTLALTPVSAAPGAARRGTLTLSVRNTGGRRQTARFRVEPEGGVDPGWFAFDGAAAGSGSELERDFETGATQTVVLTVTAPGDEPAGPRLLRVRVTAESDPDNDFVHSPAVTVTVPEAARPTPEPKKPFPWWIVAAAAAVVLIVGGVVAVMMWPPERPDLAGRSRDEARQALVQAGYAEAKIVFAPGEPEGKAPGTVLAVAYGDTVRVTFDPGVKVPALVGQPLDRARVLLRDAKLAEGARTDVASPPGSPADIVQGADPAPDATVASGTAVALRVSRPGALPDVAGTSQDEARRRLTAAGIPAANIRFVAGPPGGKPPGEVQSASLAGQQVEVRFDPGVKVPAIIDLTVDQALSMLRAAQLDVGPRSTVATPPGSPANVVKAANPAPGATVASGTPVALQLSQPQPAPAASIDGAWKNVDDNTRGVTRLRVAGGRLQVWGSCSPTDCDWGETALTAMGSGRFSAFYDHGFAEQRIQLDLEANGTLEMSVATVFKDGSGRPNRVAEYRMERDRRLIDRIIGSPDLMIRPDRPAFREFFDRPAIPGR